MGHSGHAEVATLVIFLSSHIPDTLEIDGQRVLVVGVIILKLGTRGSPLDIAVVGTQQVEVGRNLKVGRDGHRSQRHSETELAIGQGCPHFGARHIVGHNDTVQAVALVRGDGEVNPFIIGGHVVHMDKAALGRFAHLSDGHRNQGENGVDGHIGIGHDEVVNAFPVKSHWNGLGNIILIDIGHTHIVQCITRILSHSEGHLIALLRIIGTRNDSSTLGGCADG